MPGDNNKPPQSYPLISFPLLLAFIGKQLAKLFGTRMNVAGPEHFPVTNPSLIQPLESAVIIVSKHQKIILAVILVLVTGSLLINWLLTLQIIIGLLTLHYFFDLIFNLFLISRSFSHAREIPVDPGLLKTLPDSYWPTYTIFCPLYKEGQILPQFIRAISGLDYPKDKLQVLILLEEDDLDTFVQARRLNLPSYFQITFVPHSLPKTKPKACNYGLSLAKGEYCVIYDAEDIPDVYQLKKAYLVFKNSAPDVGCVQAKLNFYNSRQNFLTRLFTADYSLWFNLVLTGLQSIHAPIPLGGTSNHFKTDLLKKLAGWDAYNVTEDADLGIRLHKRGFKTVMIDSFTSEEAAASLPNWFRQRTRWIKGYMQTYLVHTRQLSHFKGWKGLHRLLSFQSVVGGKVMSLFINPLMWVMTITYFALRPVTGDFIESLYLTPVFYLAVFTFIIGNFLYFYYFLMGLAKAQEWDLIIYTVLVPFYWILISLAAFNAGLELIRKPFHWNKTVHGAHIRREDAVPLPKAVSLSPIGSV